MKARIKAAAISEPDNQNLGECMRKENSTTVYFCTTTKLSIINYKFLIYS